MVVVAAGESDPAVAAHPEITADFLSGELVVGRHLRQRQFPLEHGESDERQPLVELGQDFRNPVHRLDDQPVHLSLVDAARIAGAAAMLDEDMIPARRADRLDSAQVVDIDRVGYPLVGHFEHPQSDVSGPQPGVSPLPREELRRGVLLVTQFGHRLADGVDPLSGDGVAPVDHPAHRAHRYSGKFGDVFYIAIHMVCFSV